MKPQILKIIFLLALVTCIPVANAANFTWSIDSTNGSYTAFIANTSYVPNDGYVPIHIWAVIMIGGITFLILSLFFEKAEIVTSFIAALLFGTSAYASLVLIIPSNINMLEFTNTSLSGGIINYTVVGVLQPAVYYVGSIWLAVLCIGLFLIAALKAFFGYSNMLLKAGEEAESEGEIGIGPKIEYSEGKSMEEVSKRRSGLK
jgi:hypothetical protein